MLGIDLGMNTLQPNVKNSLYRLKWGYNLYPHFKNKMFSKENSNFKYQPLFGNTFLKESSLTRSIRNYVKKGSNNCQSLLDFKVGQSAVSDRICVHGKHQHIEPHFFFYLVI